MQELDSIFEEFAEAFAGRIRSELGEIASPSLLSRAQLDYSLNSLDEVDRYLGNLVARKVDLADQEYENTVLWGGAYAGEVIRRNAQLEYHWTPYEDFMATHENLRKVLPFGFTTRTLLCCVDGAMTMPINKVARFLDEGPENSLRYYAGVECNRK